MTLTVPRFSRPSSSDGQLSGFPASAPPNPAVRGVREERERIQQQTTIWEPASDPQRLALDSPADVIGYGGQAGGGKTDLIVGAAITRHYRAIIFRREYPQLKDIVARAKELTEGTRTSFNANENLLTRPGGGTLEFGAMQRPDDWHRYKGRAKDLMAIDEATEFLEAQVRSVIGWVRSTRAGQRCRVILTFNPPTTEEGEWVIRFFAPWLDEKHPNPAQAGELRWFAMVDGEEIERPDGQVFRHETPDGQVEYITPLSRTFIPAKLADNRYLDNNGEYRRVLQSLPEPLRSQLLYGKFNVARNVNPWQVIPTAWVLAAQKRWIERGGAHYVPGVKQTALGVDVAHGGNDQTVLAPRYGDWVAPLQKFPGKATPDGKSAARVAFDAYETGALLNVDAIGYGASCAERLSEPEPEGFGIKSVQAVNFATKSAFTDKSGKYKMRNLRAEAYWRLREALDPDNDSTLCLPDDRELLADLCAPTYEPTPSGILVESKEDVKARLPGKRSPDCGDAVTLSLLPKAAKPSDAVGYNPVNLTFGVTRSR